MTLLDDAPAPTKVEPMAPGVYDMPAEDYHARPELSSSGMRKLLSPSCPALFRWEQLAPPEPKDEFDFGHVAHKLVLGEGEQIEVLSFDSYRTADARAAKLHAYAVGRVPILEKEYAKAKAMAAEVRKHPIAGLLLSSGKPEQSLFWRDPSTGQEMKARVDWLRRENGKRLKMVDYKTIIKVDLDSIARAIAEFGYHQQGATYREGAIVLGLGGRDTVVNIIFQMKTAPFLVRVVQIPEMDLRLGEARNRRAIALYRKCLETGHWPGYEETSYVDLPAWARTRDELEYMP